MEQLQEMFGPLVEEQLGAMDWAPVKREAEGETAPANRGKAPRTEQGKGGPGPQVHSSKPPWRRAGGKGRHAEGPQQTQMIKALTIQQETALKILRQDYSWVLFVQPRNQGPLPMLYAAAQKWKKAQEGKHHNHYTQNSAVWLFDSDASCGTQGHRERGARPFPEKSGGDEMAEGWPLELSKVVPCTREPGGGRSQGPSATHQAYLEAIMAVLPLIMQPHMIHRFHATRPLTRNMTGIATFQLDISNRTSGHQQVWECLEALTGLTALQVIGLQLRRDTLKQSPAAALVQQALADCS